ncbi:carotenoid oxygenase family protein [Aquiflexum sp.]|uniref:carotenoid oxygenase family protein n=1 Tax=Aquiflexum sp. TaxID=1872584 RepID=UPI003594538A
MARAFSTASTTEIDVELMVIEGTIPPDIYGYVFINSACGTVSSKGLPYLENLPEGGGNEEFGSPLINGEGVVIRFDLNESGKIKVSSGLLKAPCYYADVATSSPDSDYGKDFRFRNIGLGRRSLRLGTRNQLSTAVMPIRFKSEGKTRLLATFDAGRPYEFDPKTFKLITPIGKNKIWRSFLPFFLNTPFKTVMSTAHPVFDPDTEELFTVNFGKSKKEAWLDKVLFEIYVRHENHLRDFLVNLSQKINFNAQGQELKIEQTKMIKAIEEFAFSEHLKDLPFASRIITEIREFFNKWSGKVILSNNTVFLMKWNGQKTMEQWEILDEKGNPINLAHNMHQIGFSKKYILLCDTNFKFTFDTMLNFPFQNDPKIGPLIRKIMCQPMNDTSMLYLVKRSDLSDSNNKKVRAKSIPLKHETVHFSVDYDDSDDIITIHSAHNCCACVADWLRSYDTLATDPDRKIKNDKLGLIAVGEMDIGRIGRLKIDAANGKLIDSQSEFKFFDGLENGNIAKAHTWGIGLYTHRDMLSYEANTPKITHIFWQSYGLKKEHLSKFIFDMYSDNTRPNKQFASNEMLELTKKGAPPVLQCVNTLTMESEDFYAFGKEQYMWSLQFMPKKANSSTIPAGKDGYILTTVINGKPSLIEDEIDYLPEIWIFDANDLKNGPKVRLKHPDFSFGFTIHSVWVEHADEVNRPDYAINIREDYPLKHSKIFGVIPFPDILKSKRDKKIAKLFENEIYPKFDN